MGRGCPAGTDVGQVCPPGKSLISVQLGRRDGWDICFAIIVAKFADEVVP